MNMRTIWLPLALTAAVVTCACGSGAEAEEQVERVVLSGRSEEAPSGEGATEEAPARDGLAGPEDLAGPGDDAPSALQARTPIAAGDRYARLNARDRATYATLVAELLSPCGDPTPVGECAEDESSSCGDCLPATHYVARLLDEGATDDEIRMLYRHRYFSEPVELAEGGSPVRGPRMAAQVTLVEFSDFECPHCAAARPLLERTLERFEGRVRLVFKHFPLSFHQYATEAARAAVAAGNQGKFWEMHDLLFENQHALTRADLERYARELHLDMDRFLADLESEATAAAVAHDREQGLEIGIRGTPSIFVNGRLLQDPHETLEDFVAEELERR